MTVDRPLRIKGADPNRAYAPKEIKALREGGERDDAAPPIIRKIHKKGPKPTRCAVSSRRRSTPSDRLSSTSPDGDLRDTEQVPLLEPGGIESCLRREVLPHAADAWYDSASVRTGYDVSFTRYFYKPQPLRSLEEIRADILALEKETEGLLAEIVGTTAPINKDDRPDSENSGQRIDLAWRFEFFRLLPRLPEFFLV